MDKNSKDLRVLKTRQNIKNALLDIMSQKNLSEITITEVSEKAMINRKTFYRHYDSIGDVIEEIEGDIVKSLVSLLKKNNASCIEISVVLRYIGTVIEENKAILYKIAKLSPEYIYTGKLREMLRRTMEISLKNIIGIKDEHLLKTLSQFTVCGIIAIYDEWLENGCKESLEFIVESTKKLTYGSLTPFIPEDKLKSIKLI